MKICSVCRQCYDDSAAICTADDNGALIPARDGNCLSVEDYRLEFRLEQDFPAEIYKATHLASEKNVLIRFIKAEDASDDLQTEIESVAVINHPNLARVFEFGKVSDDEIYVVSEDIAGQNLRTFLEKNSPLKELHAIKIARQIAEGLEELHSKSVVHRAVSPANIYFINSENKDFEVKLQNYDFGGLVEKKIVKGANGIDAKTEIFRYFSPEQLAGETVDLKSDHYSLAVVFYEMLLGRSPYDALDPQAISNYVFTESDVEKLHFDLRALLGYTLRQSFQHRKNLRPPTTNNLVRQFRHLELVAAPHTISDVRKNTAKEKTKKPFVREVRLIENKLVEKYFDEQEKIVDLENEKIEIADVRIFEPNLESPENKITPPQNNFAQNNFEGKVFLQDFESSEITIDLPETVSEDIHITNRNFDKQDEPEIYFSDLPDDKDYVQEEDLSPADRHIMNSFGAYAEPQHSSFNKNYLYIAGISIAALFGIFAAVGFFGGQNNDSASGVKPPIIANVKSTETPAEFKAEKVSKIQETADISNEENAPPVLPESPVSDNIETVEKPAKIAFEKSKVNKVAERKIQKVSADKKEIKPQKAKSEQLAGKTERKKHTPTVKKSDGMTRPRIVPNVRINN